MNKGWVLGRDEKGDWSSSVGELNGPHPQITILITIDVGVGTA